MSDRQRELVTNEIFVKRSNVHAAGFTDHNRQLHDDNDVMVNARCIAGNRR